LRKYVLKENFSEMKLRLRTAVKKCQAGQ